MLTKNLVRVPYVIIQKSHMLFVEWYPASLCYTQHSHSLPAPSYSESGSHLYHESVHKQRVPLDLHCICSLHEDALSFPSFWEPSLFLLWGWG